MPDEIGRILVALGHPNRLPILIALEDRPRSVPELVSDLGLKRYPVKHAIKQLHTAGLVQVVDEHPVGNFVTVVYATPLTGWTKILDAVTTVAATD